MARRSLTGAVAVERSVPTYPTGDRRVLPACPPPPSMKHSISITAQGHHSPHNRCRRLLTYVYMCLHRSWHRIQPPRAPLPTPPRVHAFLCGKRPSAKGGCTVVPDCDRRRCRDALYVDSLVKEFAARFGRELQQARPDGIPCFRSMSHLSNPIPSHAVSHTLAVSHHTAVSAPSSVSHLYPVGAYSTSESAPCALLASPCWSP